MFPRSLSTAVTSGDRTRELLCGLLQLSRACHLCSGILLEGSLWEAGCCPLRRARAWVLTPETAQPAVSGAVSHVDFKRCVEPDAQEARLYGLWLLQTPYSKVHLKTFFYDSSQMFLVMQIVLLASLFC